MNPLTNSSNQAGREADVAQMVRDLQASLIELWTEEGRLCFRAPQGAMTADVREQLKNNKAALIAYLEQVQLAQERAAAGIVRLPKQEHYELSPAQWRLWVLMQMETSSVAYNVPLHQLITGVLDAEALRDSLNRLVARHESLRSCFVMGDDGAPRQKVLEAVDIALETVDLSNSGSVDTVEKIALELGLEEAQRPFDLTTAPLLRAKLVRLAPQRHALLLTLHHIICDGVSIGILNREMVQLYGGAELLPLSLQYRDYAHWQNRWLASDEAAEHRRYWHTKLGGELPVLNFPADKLRPAMQTFEGAEHTVRFDPGTVAQMRQLARSQGVTLFMLLLALLKTLLYRYTNQTDLIVGSPVAARSQAELANQIGFYLNTLAFRTLLDENMPFADLLTQVKKTVTNGLDHQLYPLDQLVNELNVQRDLSHGALFDVMLVLQNQADEGMQLGDLQVQSFFQHSQTSKADLMFQFGENQAGLHLAIEYNTDLFEADRIERMGEHWRTLVSSVLKDVNQPIDRLGILPKAEHALIRGFNRPSAETKPSDQNEPENAKEATLVGWFEAQVTRTPDAIAVQYESEALSYVALNRKANQLAFQLVAQGATAETLVALCIERSIDMVVAILGVLKAGAAYVPLDSTIPAERLAFMLGDSQISIVVTQQAVLNQLPVLARVDRVLILDELDFAHCPAQNLDRPISADSLAYVIYTSGSTGQPKGVMVTHRNVVRLFSRTAEWYRFSHRDVWTLFHSYAFDFSVWEIWGALLYGGRLVVVPYETSRTPTAFYNLLVDERVTVLNQTPSAFKQLIQADERHPKQLHLRKVIFGGEALDIASLRPWFDRHGDGIVAISKGTKGAQLINMYGITETTVHVTYRPLLIADLNSSASVIGRPIPDLQLTILDPHGQPVPVGVPGEIIVSGAGVARGYLNRPELTAERFLSGFLGGFLNEDQAEPAGRWPHVTGYRSGDLARWLPTGDLEYLGRIDDQVKVRGFRIELGEVETALIACTDVDMAVAMVQTDADGDNQLVAYVVPHDGLRLSTEELRREMRQFLPEYMLPAYFVWVETIPLTPNGKVDRKRLQATAGLDLAQTHRQTAYVPPRNEIERQMVAIWEAVLGVPQVGVNDNFFDLGGHSLKGMRIVARIQQEMGKTVSFLDLFKEQTIATVSAVLVAADLPESAKHSQPESNVTAMTDEELALLWGDES
jgi:amino acid adenylation domain-containing protein